VVLGTFGNLAVVQLKNLWGFCEQGEMVKNPRDFYYWTTRRFSKVATIRTIMPNLNISFLNLKPGGKG